MRPHDGPAREEAVSALRCPATTRRTALLRREERGAFGQEDSAARTPLRLAAKEMRWTKWLSNGQGLRDASQPPYRQYQRVTRRPYLQATSCSLRDPTSASKGKRNRTKGSKTQQSDTTSHNGESVFEKQSRSDLHFYFIQPATCPFLCPLHRACRPRILDLPLDRVCTNDGTLFGERLDRYHKMPLVLRCCESVEGGKAKVRSQDMVFKQHIEMRCDELRDIVSLMDSPAAPPGSWNGFSRTSRQQITILPSQRSYGTINSVQNRQAALGGVTFPRPPYV